MSLDHFYRDLFATVANNYDFIFIDRPLTMGQAVTAASLYAGNKNLFSSLKSSPTRGDFDNLTKELLEITPA